MAGWTTALPFTLRPATRWRRFWRPPLPKTSSCVTGRKPSSLLLLEGDKVFKTKHLSAQLGCSRLSFAGEEDLARLLGVQPGSASLLCLLQDPGCAVQLVLDRPLLRQAYLGLHPCQNTSTLRIAMGDVLERVIPALGHSPLLVDLPEDPL